MILPLFYIFNLLVQSYATGLVSKTQLLVCTNGSYNVVVLFRLYVVQTGDQPLSAQGWREAEKLAAYMRADKKLAGRKITIYSSPFLRCLQTTAPLARELEVPVTVHPDIYEVGGVYTQDPEDPIHRVGSQKSMSANQIRTAFPGYGTNLLPSSGPWYKGGWETDNEARNRIEKVVRWLTSKQFKAQHRGNVVVLVAHGHTILYLLLKLLGLPIDESRDKEGINNYSDLPIKFSVPNTCTSTVTLHVSGDITVGCIGSTAHLLPEPKWGLGQNAIKLVAFGAAFAALVWMKSRSHL